MGVVQAISITAPLTIETTSTLQGLAPAPAFPHPPFFSEQLLLFTDKRIRCLQIPVSKSKD